MNVTKKIQTYSNGEQFIEFSQEELNELGWEVGDVLDWNKNKDGSFCISKKNSDTEWVMVDTVSMFRIRYCIEVPTGKHFVALNKVAAEEAKEFSQVHLTEQVTTCRVISKEEALKICKQENDYVNSWEDHQIIESFFNSKNNKVTK